MTKGDDKEPAQVSNNDNNNSQSALSFIAVASHDKPNVSLCQALRRKVFVEEQGIPSDVEIDGKDHSPLAHHLLVQSTNASTPENIGTGRIVFSKEKVDDDSDSDNNSSSPWIVSLGRIVVVKEWRKRGIGKQIVKQLEALALAQSTRVVERLVLTPHSYLEAFYTSLGFSRVPGGDQIVNDDCTLITMEKRFLTSPNACAPVAPPNRKRRICLFGTSANPPTGAGGHLGIVQALLDMKSPSEMSTDDPLFDEVHVLPVYQHTFAAKRHQLLCYDHRVAMCELAFCSMSPRVVASRAEERSFQRMAQAEGITSEDELAELRVGTAALLEMLVEEDAQAGNGNNNAEFSFCLGADTFMDLTERKWLRSKDILRMLEGRLVVVHRKGMSREVEYQERLKHVNEKEGGRVTFLDIAPLEVVSSTMARETKDEDRLRQLVPSGVVDYILSHKLYSFQDSTLDT